MMMAEKMDEWRRYVIARGSQHQLVKEVGTSVTTGELAVDGWRGLRLLGGGNSDGCNDAGDNREIWE